MKRLLIAIFIIFIKILSAQAGEIVGVVLDAKNESPIAGANIVIEALNVGTQSDENGEFVLERIPEGEHQIKASARNYIPHTIEIVLGVDEIGEVAISLLRTPVLGKETVDVGTRAISGETPAAFSGLNDKTIERRYYAQSPPAILSDLPNSFYYPEDGNGIARSHLFIRGFDQQRISVMLNGVPQNNPENHGLVWLRFPDLFGLAEDVQVQRGAGSAFYGPPAVGGSINILTSGFSAKPGLKLYSGFGSYRTRKYAASANSGLIKNRAVFFGRVSQIKSDGYRDSAWANLKSYFFGAGYFSENASLRLHIFGGPAETHLASTGIQKSKVNNDALRRENPFGMSGEIEKIHQPHFQLIHEYDYRSNLRFTNTFFGDFGFQRSDADGSALPLSYYRLTPEFGFQVAGDPDETYANQILVRRQVESSRYGWLPQVRWFNRQAKIILGSEFGFYQGSHWGRIEQGSSDLPPAISGQYHDLNYLANRKFYDFKTAVNNLSPYLHFGYQLQTKMRLLLDFQLAYRKYRLYNEKFLHHDFSVHYLFYNPRAGVNYQYNDQFNIFASYSQTKREPPFRLQYDASNASLPQAPAGGEPRFELNRDGSYNFSKPLIDPETMYDYELGAVYRTLRWTGSLNLYYMDFKNEIIENARLDKFGHPLTGNAARASHSGIEFGLKGYVVPALHFWGNVSYNHSEFRNTTVFDTAANPVNINGNTKAASPKWLANVGILIRQFGFGFSLRMKYADKQYVNNFEEEEFSVDPYTVFNGELEYSFKNIFGASVLRIQLQLRNILNNKYAIHGRDRYYFPAAERYFFMNAELGI